MKKQFGSFSDAIRYGATLRPQGEGGTSAQAAVGRSCAILAGAEAMTGTLWIDGDYQLVKRAFPYLLNPAECPQHCQDGISYKPKLLDVLYHLNDEHKWTREAIADWLQEREDELGFVTISVTEESQATLNLKAELSELGETLKEVSV